MANDKQSVNDQFTIPLIFAAALLSFAHGANDVANAVGPLAGINEAIMGGAVSTSAAIPTWVLVFGVGFLREFLEVNYARMLAEIREHHVDDSPEAVEAFLERFEAANVTVKGEMLRELKQRNGEKLLQKKERRDLGRIHRVELVKRSLLLLIAAAWVVTVPAAAFMAAMLFYMIRGMMLP